MRRVRQDPWRDRLLAMSVMVGVGFLVLLGQLWYLQVLEGSRLRELSEKNRLRVRVAAAPRGILFDRNGVPLVDNRPAFTLSAIPREMEDRQAVLARLAVLLKIPYAELAEALERVPPDSLMPVRLRRGLTLEEVTRVEEWKLELPGVVVEVEPQRAYSTSRFAAHILGFVREASEEQVRRGRYRRGDMVGQSGIEQLLDGYLRGRDGGERIEVDALGRPVQLLRRQEPVPGAQVVTTVDWRIQELAERVMNGRAGVALVMDPRNGDILAMTSNPAFDLEQFAGPLGRETWLRLVRDPQTPLLNRALQGQYAPGSIFKIVVTAAGLQEGSLTPADSTYCNGEFRLGQRVFKDWKEGGHGHMDLRQALIHSCNVFFYRAGLKVGVEAMARYARAFGLGSPTGIALQGERPGLVPLLESPRGRRARAWQAGDTVNLSIGQGRLLVTPLQVARMMAAVANGGILWKPRVVQRVEQAGGQLIYAEASQMTGHVDLSPVVWEFLRQSLWGVVNQGGTGAAAQLPGLEVAGKTGTAQIVAKSQAARGEEHAWFAAYAPAQDPQVVVVVLVEHGGRGGQVAAPLARKILQGIFLEKVALAGASG